MCCCLTAEAMLNALTRLVYTPPDGAAAAAVGRRLGQVDAGSSSTAKERRAGVLALKKCLSFLKPAFRAARRHGGLVGRSGRHRLPIIH